MFLLPLRGVGAKALRHEIEAVGGICAEGVILRAVGADKHLGTLVTSTACPTQDAARRVSLAGSVYAKVSGHVLSSQQLDLIVKLQASAATVDATLLHGSKSWAHIAAGPALRIEAMHTRWLRKATGEYRAVSEDWQSEAEVRVTYNVASTCSLIAFCRLAYLSSLGKASPFLRALLQHNVRAHPWVRQTQEYLV